MTIETLPMLVLAASTLALPRSAFNCGSAWMGDPADRTASAAPSARPDDEERGDDDEEEELASLADLPRAVREAIQRVVRPSAIREVEKVTKAGVTTYEAEYRADGEEHSVKVSVGGEVLEVEREVAPARLPAEVRAAVHKRLPRGVIREAEAVYVGGGASPTHYEVEVKDGGHTHKLKVGPSGEILGGSR